MLVNFNPGTPLDEICRESVRAGCVGMDLIPPVDWPALRKHGLTPSTCPRDVMTIEDGMIRKEAQNRVEKSMRDLIDRCAADGCPNLIGWVASGAVSHTRKGRTFVSRF